MTEILPSAEAAFRVMIALIFISSAVGKVASWWEFREILARYELLPLSLVTPAALIVPAVEAAIAVGLVLGGSPLTSGAGAALLAVYGFAIGINLVRGNVEIDCGCSMTAQPQQLRWTLVARNAVLAALLMAADSATSLFSGPYWIQGAMAGLVLFLFYASLNTLWAITPYWRRGHDATGAA